MAYTPIVIGSLNWGAPVNAAFTSQDARITAIERSGNAASNVNGFLAQPYDVTSATSGTVLTSGTPIHIRIDIPFSTTFTNMTIPVFTAGATLTAAQNLFGLYDSLGNRVAISADQSASWVTAGDKTAAFTVPYAAAAGTYYMSILSNGTTPIAVARSVNTGAVQGVINHNLTAATARWSNGPAGQTTLPTTITMASRVLINAAYWSGLS
jgi:hypothetical protein